MIKVQKEKFTYIDNKNLEYTVFKVISDYLYLGNTYILDRPCEENNFKCPDENKVRDVLVSDFKKSNYEKIDGYIYNQNDLSGTWLKILSLEREFKINLLIE